MSSKNVISTIGILIIGLAGGYWISQRTQDRPTSASPPEVQSEEPHNHHEPGRDTEAELDSGGLFVTRESRDSPAIPDSTDDLVETEPLRADTISDDYKTGDLVFWTNCKSPSELMWHPELNPRQLELDAKELSEFSKIANDVLHDLSVADASYQSVAVATAKRWVSEGRVAQEADFRVNQPEGTLYWSETLNDPLTGRVETFNVIIPPGESAELDSALENHTRVNAECKEYLSDFFEMVEEARMNAREK